MQAVDTYSTNSEYVRGYFAAMDDVLLHINTLDIQDVKSLRSAIYKFCVEARPK